MSAEDNQPSTRELLLTGVALAVGWGLIFGWIDGAVWTLANWLEALAGGALVVVTIMVLLRFRAFRQR